MRICAFSPWPAPTMVFFTRLGAYSATGNAGERRHQHGDAARLAELEGRHRIAVDEGRLDRGLVGRMLGDHAAAARHGCVTQPHGERGLVVGRDRPAGEEDQPIALDRRPRPSRCGGGRDRCRGCESVACPWPLCIVIRLASASYSTSALDQGADRALASPTPCLTGPIFERSYVADHVADSRQAPGRAGARLCGARAALSQPRAYRGPARAHGAATQDALSDPQASRPRSGSTMRSTTPAGTTTRREAHSFAAERLTRSGEPTRSHRAASPA